MAAQPISNLDYDMASVIYHAGQGAETAKKYVQDAQQSGSQECAQFLQDAVRQYEQIAQRGIELLKQSR